MNTLADIINLVLCTYSVLLITLIITILRKVKAPVKHKWENVSVIVPFRNEAKNLGDLLLSLGSQDYKGKFELILINDHSDDNYNHVIEHMIETLQYSIKIINSNFNNNVNLTGKQQALETGIKNSSHSWLAFTDADVVLEKNWLSSLVNQADNSRTIVFGHTSVHGKKQNIIEKYSAFQLEYLFSAAYGFSLLGIPGSCMGNNLLISKELYNEIGGQEAIGYTITEDMQLVNRALKAGAIVEPVKPFHPTVLTSTPSTLIDMIHQSVRWARGGIKSNITILLITFLSSIQAILFLCTPLFYLNTPFINTANITVVNVLLLFLYISIYIRGTQAPIKRYFFPVFYILYAIQSVLLAIPLFFIKPRWKERTL